jgi:acylphosphatase
VNVRVHIVVSGIVQGVFFRSETRKVAARQGVTGWVRNHVDGHVEAVLEGDDVAVNAVIAFCRRGPPRAWVKDVEVMWDTYRGVFDDFSIYW